MTNLNNILSMVIKAKELNDRWGWVSCFDAPEAYEEMENVNSAIYEATKEMTASDIGRKHLEEVFETIAFDVVNGGESPEDVELHHYSLDEYLEAYVLESMDEPARNLFDSLFYFMDSDTRIKWVEANYLSNDPYAYSDKWLDHIIIVGR